MTNFEVLCDQIADQRVNSVRYPAVVVELVASEGVFSELSNRIVSLCDGGRILVLGAGSGELVATLLRNGIDATGVEDLLLTGELASQSHSSPSSGDSAAVFSFDHTPYHVIILADCLRRMEHVALESALTEIFRVAKRFVFLLLTTTDERLGCAIQRVEGRIWWETKCFDAGFRKHPAYYKLNDYESLNSDPKRICIPLEKVPPAALLDYPLASLSEERGLHMDMTRDAGERSDAHIIRYQWACNYIKSGDRVLDAACGLGYGGHVIRHLTQAAKVVGIDGSAYAIDYANKAFPCAVGRAEYLLGTLPVALTDYPDCSFEVIVSFETLEHVEQPKQLLREFYRLLTPGGRVVVSVPNDWSDESGEDPNPFHLHVYDWTRLKSELTTHFILEDAFAQTASQCKIAQRGGAWERRPRAFKQVSITEQATEDCEWWLMTAMKSPMADKLPYTERLLANIAVRGHPLTAFNESYHNPWLVHAMVNLNCRLKNGDALEGLALEVMAISTPIENDYAAALCVLAYRVLGQTIQDAVAVGDVIAKITAVAAHPVKGPTGLRWKVSLLFVKAKLLKAQGHLALAKAAFIECASHDVRPFGIHLATKTTEAWFIAGRLAHAMGNTGEAKFCWEQGVESGSVLLSVSLDDILINRSFPNRFNSGDGIREYTLAWDNIARCANGLHLLKQGGMFDYSALENCFQTEYSTVTRDLLDARLQLTNRGQDLVQTRQELSDRSARLEKAGADLLDRTEELVASRKALEERSALLDSSNAALKDQTQELVQIRQELSERSALLEQAGSDLLKRTDELVATRKALEERSALLDSSNAALKEQTQELVQTRQELSDRSARLEKAGADLLDRTEELVASRLAVEERTELLESSNAALKEQTQELVQTRQELGKRTALLAQAGVDLLGRTEELVASRLALEERTELLESSNAALKEQTQELVQTRQDLGERTALLAQAGVDLLGRTEELVASRQALEERTELLVSSNAALKEQTQELVQTRQELSDRSARLEKAGADLLDRTEELVASRQALEERTELLESSSAALKEQTQELVQTRQELGERTELLKSSNAALMEQTLELVQTRQKLTDLSEQLGHANTINEGIKKSPLRFSSQILIEKILRSWKS